LTIGSGLLLIDKPEGWTSHDVVAKLRGVASTRRVGHAGTLDPMATGLLVIGVNNATKLLTFIVGESKTYTGTIRLGASTLTDDRESEYISTASAEEVAAISDDQLAVEIAALTGEIMQVPASVSAIKVNGERAYAKVRGGDEVKLQARAVTVSRFVQVGPVRHVTENEQSFIDLDVIIDCSSGTYIRALARDLGRALGVGGHLTALRRTRVGGYTIEQGQQLADLSQDTLQLVSNSDAARAQFAARELTPQDAIDIRHGKRIAVGEISPAPVVAVQADAPIAAFDETGALIAMLTEAGSTLKSLVVFQEEAK
jgi:tRNA pseudouridine55 synthase